MADFVRARKKWPEKRRPGGQKIYKRKKVHWLNEELQSLKMECLSLK